MVALPSSCPRRGVYVRLVARRFRLSEATAGRPRRRRRGAGVSDALEAFMGARGPSVALTRPRGPPRAVYGKERRCDGYGGGGRGPGTPVDASVVLDVVWRAAGRSMTWTVERSFVRIE